MEVALSEGGGGRCVLFDHHGATEESSECRRQVWRRFSLRASRLDYLPIQQYLNCRYLSITLIQTLWRYWPEWTRKVKYIPGEKSTDMDRISQEQEGKLGTEMDRQGQKKDTEPRTKRTEKDRAKEEYNR